MINFSALLPASVNPVLLPFPTVSLARRLTCLVYEAFLLAAIAFVASLVLIVLQFIVHVRLTSLAYQVISFVLFGVYFVYCWTKGGQTLAMRVWKIKVLSIDGRLPSRQQAIIRYVGGWMWVFPAMLYNIIFNTSLMQTLCSFVVNLVFWAASYAFFASQQFLHDALAQTTLVDLAHSIDAPLTRPK